MSDPYFVSPLTAEGIPAAFPPVSVPGTGATEDDGRACAEALVATVGNGVGPGIGEEHRRKAGASSRPIPTPIPAPIPTPIPAPIPTPIPAPIPTPIPTAA